MDIDLKQNLNHESGSLVPEKKTLPRPARSAQALKDELAIRLSQSQVKPVALWIKHFSEHHKACFTQPIVEENVLRIHPYDALALLAHYADKVDSNEFDVYRLKALVIAGAKRIAARKKSPLAKMTFDNLVDALAKVEPNCVPHTNLYQRPTGFAL